MKAIIPALALFLCTEGVHAADRETLRTSYLVDPALQAITPPDYPSLALQFALQGNVEVMLWIDNEGIPTGGRIVESSSVIFEEPALSSALNSRFTPAVDASGLCVPSVVRIPFVFRLR